MAIVSAQLICTSPQQAGLFNDFDADGDDDDSEDGDGGPPPPPPTPPLTGAIIGSAFVEEAEGPNDNAYGAGADELNGPGFAPLTSLLPSPRVTRDSCVLRISFRCPSGYDRVAIKYIFGSDNYPSTGTNVNEDLMGAFLNGREARNNIARAPNSNNNYVSVNTQFSGPNFVDNTGGIIQTEMNGFTVLREAVGQIRPPGQTNVLEIAVADGGLPPPPPTRAPTAAPSPAPQPDDNSNDGDGDGNDGDRARRQQRQLRHRGGGGGYSLHGGRRDLQVSAGQASGAYVLLTQRCLECIKTTNLSRDRGVTPVTTCAQIAGTGSRCRCAWSCMSSAIKRRCVFTGATTGYSTYVSQVRSRINSKYCRRRRTRTQARTHTSSEREPTDGEGSE